MTPEFDVLDATAFWRNQTTSDGTEYSPKVTQPSLMPCPRKIQFFSIFSKRAAIWAIIKVAGTCELNSHLGGRRLCQWERFQRIRLLKNNESHWCRSCPTQLLAKREIFHFSMLLHVMVERHHHYHHEIWRREATVGLAGAVAVGWLEHAAIRVFPQILYSSIS